MFQALEFHSDYLLGIEQMLFPVGHFFLALYHQIEKCRHLVTSGLKHHLRRLWKFSFSSVSTIAAQLLSVTQLSRMAFPWHNVIVTLAKNVIFVQWPLHCEASIPHCTVLVNQVLLCVFRAMAKPEV